MAVFFFSLFLKPTRSSYYIYYLLWKQLSHALLLLCGGTGYTYILVNFSSHTMPSIKKRVSGFIRQLSAPNAAAAAAGGSSSSTSAAHHHPHGHDPNNGHHKVKGSKSHPGGGQGQQQHQPQKHKSPNNNHHHPLGGAAALDSEGFIQKYLQK